MKKTLLSLSCLITTLFSNAQGPDFQWAKNIIGTASGYGTSIAVDPGGNVYTTGVFTGTTDFDPGPGTFSLTPATTGDAFISKLDPSGNFVWAKHIGGTSISIGKSINVDAFGNILIAGYYKGTTDFDPGIGVFNLTSDSLGFNDIFILKLDPSGNFLWAKSMGGTTGDDYCYSMTTDVNGNVYTTGVFVGTVDFDPGIGSDSLTAIPYGRNNAFISKLDVSGNFVWAKNFGGTLGSGGYSIVLDAANNIYTTGNFVGTTDFDPNATVFNLTTSGIGSDVFISKLDVSGNFVWAKSMGGPGSDIGVAVALDAAGDIYTSGEYAGTADFDPGSGVANLISLGGDDIFISKLDASGNFIWAKSIGGTSADQEYSLAIDASDNVYTSGFFYGTADFDPGSGTYNLTNPIGGYSDMFISKLDISGNFAWAIRLGSVDYDQANAITLDGSGNIYTTGYFNDTVDFDPGAGVVNLIAPTGVWDIFVSKLSQSASGIIENTAPNDISIYPNPSNGIFNIIVPIPLKNGSVEIYNSIGALVYNQNIINQQNTIELTNRSNGLYFVKVISDNKPFITKKVIKQ